MIDHVTVEREDLVNALKSARIATSCLLDALATIGEAEAGFADVAHALSEVHRATLSLEHALPTDDTSGGAS